MVSGRRAGKSSYLWVCCSKHGWASAPLSANWSHVFDIVLPRLRLSWMSQLRPNQRQSPPFPGFSSSSLFLCLFLWLFLARELITVRHLHKTGADAPNETFIALWKIQAGKFTLIPMMKHRAGIMLGGRLSLRKSLGGVTLSVTASPCCLDTIPEEQQPLNSFRGGNGSIQSDATQTQEMACCDKCGINEGGENCSAITKFAKMLLLERL